MSDVLRPIDTSLFDADTDAADDFYRYINGGWLSANPVPPEYGSWGAFHEVNERNQELLHSLLEDAAALPSTPGSASRIVGDYFAAAMDEESIEAAGVVPLAPFLSRIDAADSITDVRDIARDLQRVGAGPLHSLGVSPDFEDADAYLVYLGQGGLGLPERDYYVRDDERSVQLRGAYATHIARQLENLGDGEEAARDAAGRILAFETLLAQASYSAEQMRDVHLTMNRREISALDELMPGFALSSYVVELGVTSPTVNVDNPEFFSALEAILAKTPMHTLRDYLRWTLVAAFASELTTAFEQESFDFYGRTLSGQQKMRPRWKRVIEAASADIGELVSQLYVEAAFSAQAKQRCEEMVDHLLSAMGAALRDAKWMSEATKQRAFEKLAGFSYKIGFPDQWRDYSGLALDRTSYVENRMRCARFEYDREMGRLGQPVDRAEWAMPAHVINAYYHPLLNEIVFPAGILQPPFFYPDADDAVNYGAIGAIIGHEITHGFDDRGSHFDANGALRDWWTEEDRAEFDKRAQVLVEQFDAFQIEEGLTVNGRLTLGENIADLGGLSIALTALQEARGDRGAVIDGLTPEQRFFASWATVWHMNYSDEYLRLLVNTDPHSPSQFRVNGPLSNLASFADAFGVAEGSLMARDIEKRAHIW